MPDCRKKKIISFEFFDKNYPQYKEEMDILCSNDLRGKLAERLASLLCKALMKEDKEFSKFFIPR